MTGIIHPHYLLDTVAAIARLNGDPAFLAALDVQAVVSIPIIVLGELYAGAENSAHVEANIRGIDQLSSGAEILLCDRATARQYARISHQLRKKGRPIPQNDLWIAALAVQHHQTVLTRDAHFNHIDGLLIKSW
jgi:tRNA(fMet)-specific endonuclease VapC